MPGRLTLAEWVPNGVNRRIRLVIRGTVDVEAACRSYDLKIGARGRLVNVCLLHLLCRRWMIRKAEIVPKNAKNGPAGRIRR